MRYARLLETLVFAAATGWGALEGCATNAPTTSYTPITGIEVRSADVVAGHGCGAGNPNQVYKYAAVVAAVSDAGAGAMSPTLVTSGVFGCFADGIFSNLPQDDAGNSSFVITIYAYNQCSFPQALACASSAGAACNAEDPNFVTQSVAAQPSNWTATCAATQLPGVTAIAYCPPLQPQDGAVPCADAGADAGAAPEASADSAAGADADADATADADADADATADAGADARAE